MMKKVAKIKGDLFSKRITYSVNKNLNNLQGKDLAPKKTKAVNELLRKLKTPLPK